MGDPIGGRSEGLATRLIAGTEGRRTDDLVVDGLKSIVVGHFGGACGQPDKQVNLGSDLDAVARSGSRRCYRERAVSCDRDIHEDVECRRDLIGLDAEWLQ